MDDPQHRRLDRVELRGQEKSVFRFGGSAIVVFGERRAWRPSEDIVNCTNEGVETLVRLGEPIGART
jgi:phosphatidylserine decarboxylase